MEQKLAALGILINSLNQILSVSRKNDQTKFGLPGGKVDDGETPEEAVIREVFEETGYKVSILPDQKPFIKEEGNYLVFCYLLKLENDTQHHISEQETGIVDFVEKEVLFTGFKEYNEAALAHFNLI